MYIYNADSISVLLHSADGVTGVYEIARVKDLPKLHRAAWKGKLAKFKDRTKGINKKNLNSQEKLGNRYGNVTTIGPTDATNTYTQYLATR